jgi:hypothetical protein
VSQHVLLAAATRRRHRAVPEMPEGATYNVASGCWMLGGVALVRTPGSRLGAPSSKKNDIETGEDQKGE